MVDKHFLVNSRKHKETFFQAAYQGVPSTWVVQYYIKGSAFPEASYFGTEEEALEFERELTK